MTNAKESECHHLPLSLNDQLSFELANQKYISAS